MVDTKEQIALFKWRGRMYDSDDEKETKERLITKIQATKETVSVGGESPPISANTGKLGQFFKIVL